MGRSFYRRLLVPVRLYVGESCLDTGLQVISSGVGMIPRKRLCLRFGLKTLDFRDLLYDISFDKSREMNRDSIRSLVRSERREALNARGDIPRLVRELRERTGLTQEKFAAKLGVTFPTINRWENGRAKPSPLALKQIEDLLRELGGKGRDLLDEYFGQEKQ